MMALEWTQEAREARVRQGLRALGRGQRTDTDADAVGELADRLAREAREVQATARRGGRGAPAARESDEFIHALHDDLKSSTEGKRLGRKFQHDPFALARSLGITVQYVPPAQLQNPNRPLGTPGDLWRLPGQLPVARLANTLNGWDAAMTLAHECAHYLGFDREGHCEQFASAFLKVDDSDTPAARWKRMSDKLLNRERERQIARGRALGRVSRL